VENAHGGTPLRPRPKIKKPFYEGKTKAPCALPVVGFEVTAHGRFEGTTQDFRRPAKEE
jgi:hypothetical protein